jgi:hypothetical protein
VQAKEEFVRLVLRGERGDVGEQRDVIAGAVDEEDRSPYRLGAYRAGPACWGRRMRRCRRGAVSAASALGRCWQSALPASG